MCRWLTVACAGLGAIASPGRAIAEVDTSTSARTASIAEAPAPVARAEARVSEPRTSSVTLTEPRPVPNYRGRDPEPITGGEAILWVPRVLLFPAYLVMEYGVRWPIVSFLAWQEEEHVFARLTGAMSFREGRSGLYPTAYYDAGLLPTVGLFFFNADLFAPGHTFSLEGELWAEDTRRAVLRDDMRVFGDDGHLDVRLEYATRPDHPYYGERWNTAQSAESFFTEDEIDAELGLGTFFRGRDHARVFARYRWAKLGPGRGTSIEDHFDVSQIAGFGGHGYQLVTAGLSLAFDSRPVDAASTLGGTGLRAELTGDFDIDPESPALSFIRWSARGSAFFDLTGTRRVLGLSLYAGFVEKTGTKNIPPSELGNGSDVLRGFFPGRFRGETLVAATLDYRYPIWVLIDADLFLEAGNAFGPRFDGFSFQRLVMSGGLALEAHLSPETSLEMVVAFGTNRFEETRFRAESARFAIGATHGF